MFQIATEMRGILTMFPLMKAIVWMYIELKHHCVTVCTVVRDKRDRKNGCIA